ncbi:MAG: preprotein translocase subunit SecY [Ignavibacteriaceae bacterium]|jgi:protein translocase subunit secY/sec61 alpha|nr:MAG: preprotein translocase subunit SecY [Chlorobiota bacterium]KXK06159.1 MAG: preprotein translocase, SecY subunit [Chlorobi bacterium OLB4]MBV6398587.1 Protein translocase subunit SecY [Ignavibacteria bacterium]MCC6885822.1 preprotein translocase subunit SecY [Ignavibacteriales bacterium]MCE7952983.1 preprotein translocase subunit SecY [Chlorobi bacterium CHB7]MDL1887179.1 preprotein translocase subunit SecY [Ignavibacteria bacterium CHB1]MEB2329233.1 preprotein translocase subunit SecY
MSGFVENFRNIFKIEELRTRILFTLALLMVVRIGAHITLPGINTTLLSQASQMPASDTLFGLYDMFVGGAFSNAAVFALGIMPYISASIIIQLLGAVFPYFQKLQKEGEEGRKKIEQLTRVGTVPIAALQAWGVSVQLASRRVGELSIISPEISPFIFTISTVVFLTAGTVFMMWLGEQITERGIGNGISLIIFINIINMFPFALLDEYQMIASGVRNILIEIIYIALLVLIIAGVIAVTVATRRIPVQYAKRVVGRKVFGGVTQYIPMKVNQAGVMPIIFAQSIMFVPNTFLTFFPNSEFMQSIAGYFDMTSYVYSFFFALLIIFFTYFYTAIAFNPKDVSDNMKRQGGFIPGVRPGKPTSDYIDNILTKITLPGSIFLALVAILPTFIMKLGVTTGLASFFGGTSLLIIVGVALDTLQQIESHLLMRHYDGFMKGSKIKSRR